MTSTYVTVAIPYVNAAPHLGYAYELVQADVFARARRLAGDDVRFLGGTDDYSLKNVLAAEAAGVPTPEFVNAHAARFEALAGPLHLSFDDFIRTSADPRHRPAVERLWLACAANGDLYKQEYAGDYCVGCERFYDAHDAAGEGAGAPAVPNRGFTSERRDPGPHDAAGEGAGAPAVPNRGFTSERRDPPPHDAAGEGAGAPAVPNRGFTSERRDPPPHDAAGEGAGAPAVPNRGFTSERRDPGPHPAVELRCPEHGTALEPIVEENWFFRLSAYQDHVDHLITSDAVVVRPAPFREEVLSFVRRGLKDISVSRSVLRARGWGIGVPGDPSQVIYVWFDALANYISALGFGAVASPDYRRWWSESDQRVHVVGKGILRFHAVYWPAFLASAGQPPPTRIQVHPYLTAGGQKLSKSDGNVVDPRHVAADYGADAVRWWFAHDVSAVADTDYTPERLVARANADLANGLGNVTNRIVNLVHRLRGGVVAEVDAEPVAAARDVEDDVAARLAGFDLRGAAAVIAAAVTALNQDLEATRPWHRTGHSDAALDRLLVRHVVSARHIARAARPIVPELAARLLAQLDSSPRLPDPAPVFARLE